MKLIDKYIVQQYIVTFLFILGMVLVICIIVDFVEKLDLFLDQEIPLEAIILDYYVNFLAYFGNLLSPICIFLGVIFFTSRMASRMEIVPILSSGVHFGRLLLPYLIMGLVALGASFIFKSYLIPISTDARLDFEYKHMGRVKKNLGKRSDIHKKVAADTYVYFHHFNERNNLGTNFGMEKIVDGEVVRKISAQKIKWIDSTQSWRLEDVEVRNFEGKEEKVIKPKAIDTTFLLTPEEIFIREQFAESMTLPDLLEFIRKEEMRGSDILNILYLERHRRFSDPIAVFILTLLGFAISFEKSRGGVAVKIGIGLILCFLYIALLYGGAIIVGEEYPPWLAVWLPNLVFFPITLLYLLKGWNSSIFDYNPDSIFRFLGLFTGRISLLVEEKRN